MRLKAVLAVLGAALAGASAQQEALIKAVRDDDAAAVAAEVAKGVRVDIRAVPGDEIYSLLGLVKSGAVLEALQAADSFDADQMSQLGYAAAHYYAMAPDDRQGVLTQLFAGEKKGNPDVLVLNEQPETHLGATALMLVVAGQAPQEARAGLTKVLLDNGADVNIQANNSDTALHWHIREGAKESALLILDSPGVDADIVGARGETALHAACTPGNVLALDATASLVSAILAKSAASMDLKNAAGNAPAHLVAASRPELGPAAGNVLRALGAAGADLSAKDAAGETPLHLAAGAGTIASLQALVEQGVKDETKNAAGELALHVIAGRIIGPSQQACNEAVAIVELLVEQAGAALDATDAEGHTPADLADAQGGLSCIDLRKALGSDVQVSRVPTSSPTASPQAAGSGEVTAPTASPTTASSAASTLPGLALLAATVVAGF